MERGAGAGQTTGIRETRLQDNGPLDDGTEEQGGMRGLRFRLVLTRKVFVSSPFAEIRRKSSQELSLRALILLTSLTDGGVVLLLKFGEFRWIKSRPSKLVFEFVNPCDQLR